MLYRLFGDINIVIIIELSNSLAFFITLFEYLRNLNEKEIALLVQDPERQREAFGKIVDAYSEQL